MQTKTSYATPIVLFIVAFNIFLIFGDFIRNPEKYGEVMRRFDEAIYQTLETDGEQQ